MKEVDNTKKVVSKDDDIINMEFLEYLYNLDNPLSKGNDAVQGESKAVKQIVDRNNNVATNGDNAVNGGLDKQD